MKLIKMVAQIAGLCLISLLGSVIADFLAIGIPGSIVGLLLLFAMIARGWIPLDKIELGANFLVAELLLFFIPSAIGVMQFGEALQGEWSQILLAIEISILSVLVFVGVATECIVRRRERRQAA